MEDKFGVPVEIGNLIIYAGGGQSDYYLHLGSVIEINSSSTKCKICDYVNKNKQQRWRSSSEIISAEYLKNSMPEYFI